MQPQFILAVFRKAAKPLLTPCLVLFNLLFNEDGAAQQNFWKDTSGPAGQNVKALAIDANGHIFAGTACCGAYRSRDDGDDWKLLPGLQDSVTSFAIDSNEQVYAGKDKSVDGGVFFRLKDSTWVALNRGLTNTHVKTLAINAMSHIFAGTDGGGMFRLKDSTWAPVNNGLTNTDVRALAINPANEYIFAGTNGGVFLSTNNGENWTAVDSGLTESSVLSFAINSRGHIFAGTDGGGIFRSTNHGGNWAPVNTDLTNPIVQALAVNSRGHIFAGTANGFFQSTNNGDRWTVHNSGLLNNTFVQSLAINSRGYVFAGTRGPKVFKSLESTTYPREFKLTHQIPYPAHKKASDYQATDYRIVGLPGGGTINRRVNDLLAGNHGMDWQAYWDNGVGSNFLVEFDDSDDFVFLVGRAFWIIKKDTLKIDATYQTEPLDASDAVKISLHSGWNLITNPFDSSIVWENIKKFNGISGSDPLYAYIGGFTPSNSFDPYVGYYFFNGGTVLPSLKIPLSLIFFGSSISEHTNPFSWQVDIALSSIGFNDRATSLGVFHEASIGLDRFDFRKPRSVPVIPAISFHRPEWDKKYSIFATDIRPEFEEKESWDFEVQSTQREELKLTFSIIERVPLQFEVYLIDQARARSVNLREDSLYTFTPAAGISQFTVLVGKAESIKGQLESIPPKELSLGQNYPNPFNPLTAIPVSIPVISEVKLKVYDILGKEVKTLYAGSLTPGRHFFPWDGRDERGNALATGVYFYRLQAGSLVQTKKLILLR